MIELRLADNRCIVFYEPAIMGVINLSSDSFYNPHPDLAAALFTAKKMVNEGADILDLRAVTTNPRIREGSPPAVQEELDQPIDGLVRWAFSKWKLIRPKPSKNM